MKVVANIKIELEVSEDVLENYQEGEMDVLSILTKDDAKYTVSDITIDDEDILDEVIDITSEVKEALLEEKA